MTELTKENLDEFIFYYHGFHDSYIKEIKYNIEKKQIQFQIDVCWSGKASLKEDGYYETNPTKMKMICDGIETFKCIDFSSLDYISSADIKFIEVENRHLICFADYSDETSISFKCEKNYYEDKNSNQKDNNEARITLTENIDKIHTTDLGMERIKNNLNLDEDVVEWCKSKIKDTSSIIYKDGKNFYVVSENKIITINSYSFTIITAHKKGK